MNGSDAQAPLLAAFDLDALAWDERGLVPVVAQDARTGDVLMMAWANREAFERTLATGDLHFWSRTRAELWHKGEVSGNTMRLVSLHADCDRDTVLARVEPAGPACHTGAPTCFGEEGRHRTEGAGPATGGGLPEAGGRGARDVLDRLAEVVRARARERPADSYTVRLLDDENLRLKKLGEETAELILALSRGPGGKVAEEAADLVYHVLVALEAAGHTLDDVRAVLASREI